MELKYIPVTNENRQAVLNLCLLDEQQGYIETVAECLEEAAQNDAWRTFGIYDGADLVGFTMYGCFTENKWGTRVWLDRLLIDKSCQGKGYGYRTVEDMCERLFAEYDTDEIYLSVYDNNKAAIHVYEKAGFRFNGEYDTKGERIMKMIRK